MSYLLSIDQGTSSSRAILFHENGDVKAVSQQEIRLFYPHNGWVEHDPHDLIKGTLAVLKSITTDHADIVSQIGRIGITNQRETVIVWDRKTGDPVYNAIVWQDRRTVDYCDFLKGDGCEDIVREKAGLLLDPYFSATKIRWILQNVEGAMERAKNGDLIFGTVDSYLIWHLTNGQAHVTDSTNASRTMLYNIKELKWDNELFSIFDIPMSMAPMVCSNISDFGYIDEAIFGRGVQIGGVAGDQQSALIGQGCVQKNMAKSTYGTGCFMLMNMGEEFVVSENKMLTTITCNLNGVVSYALEGSIFNAGTAVQFLRDNFSFFDHAKETDEMAKSLSDNGGVYFIPAFTGLGAPYWNPNARGVIAGISRDTKKEHVVRAALEAQAYQTRDLISAMEQDSGQQLDVLRVDGGLVANDFMCQFLSDQLGVAIEVPRVLESTAWGAACLAGVHAGIFESLEDASSRWQCKKRYEPSADRKQMDDLYKQWCGLIQKI